MVREAHESEHFKSSLCETIESYKGFKMGVLKAFVRV